MSLIRRSHLVLTLLLCSPAFAGEIPGLPAGLPPFVERDLELNFSNDFLGRGGSVDDFRTQQINLMARFGERWMALIDHSILTLHDEINPGRTDQLSASVGYFLVSDIDNVLSNSVAIGTGLRGSGDYDGEPMQNGFHRLIDSEVETLPYTGVNRLSVTAWIDAERYQQFYEPSGSGWFGSWRAGYWLRANSLVTNNGQWDASAAAFVVASRNAIDIWMGLRQDWRNGYDDPVERETAAAEEDLAFVLGARFGALVLETVQQFNNEASYGQLRLVSSGFKSAPQIAQETRYGFGLGFLLPDVHIELSGRISTRWDKIFNPLWPSSIVADLRYGEPQYQDNTATYVHSTQIGVGLEWTSPIAEKASWANWYGSIGAGWREEYVIGDLALDGERSESIGRAVLTLDTGLRFDAANLGSSWRYRIQTGVSAWLPFSDAEVTMAGETFNIQKPTIGLFLGMTFDAS